MSSSSGNKTTRGYLLPKRAGEETIVFWDIDDCPVPDNLNVTDVSKNIETALKKKGYCGGVKICAYGDSNLVKGDFEDEIELYHIPAGERARKFNAMLVSFLNCGIQQNLGMGTENLMLIMGDISRQMGFLMAIQSLKSKKSYNVFLAQPQKASDVLQHVVSREWIWTNLAIGGEPIDPSESESESSQTILVVKPLSSQPKLLIWLALPCFKN